MRGHLCPVHDHWSPLTSATANPIYSLGAQAVLSKKVSGCILCFLIQIHLLHHVINFNCFLSQRFSGSYVAGEQQNNQKMDSNEG